MEERSRRRLLGATGVALGTLLAGCATGGDGTTRTTMETEPTTQEPTTEPPSTQEPTTTEEPTTQAATTRTTTVGPAAVVAVGPGGDLVFDPGSVTVSVGDTVEWQWESGGHNVVVDGQPDDGGWTGTEGGASTTYGEGHTYSFTFDVAGTYDYYCAPHQSFDMRGTVVVE